MSEPDNPAGLQESVAKLHAMIDATVAQGIPSERIVVGGFSQGSAIAQHAGYTCTKRLGGIVGFSGWGMQREQVRVVASACAQGRGEGWRVQSWLHCRGCFGYRANINCLQK